MGRSAHIDDSVHPLLSKARPLGQLEIDRLDDGPGRRRYGRVAVAEVEARAALTAFTGMGDRPYAVWSLNPYAGCAHACAYCFVPKTLRAQRDRWGAYVIVKRNLPTLLGHELRRRPRGPVYVSTATDPYQPVEEEQRVTRRSLEQLVQAGWPVDVLTRSPLVVRDVDLLARGEDVRVGLTVPTLDEAFRAAVEPAAPPIAARLAALRRLADAGLTTYANYAPAYPFTPAAGPEDVAEAFADAGVQWVNTAPWKYPDAVLPVVRHRLAGTEREAWLAMITDDTRQRRTRKALVHALERRGIPVRRGFFNEPSDPRPAPIPAASGPLEGVACGA